MMHCAGAPTPGPWQEDKDEGPHERLGVCVEGGGGRKCTSETIRGRVRLEDPWALFEGVRGVGLTSGAHHSLCLSHTRCQGQGQEVRRGEASVAASCGHEALSACQTADAGPDPAPRGLWSLAGDPSQQQHLGRLAPLMQPDSPSARPPLTGSNLPLPGKGDSQVRRELEYQLKSLFFVRKERAKRCKVRTMNLGLATRVRCLCNTQSSD